MPGLCQKLRPLRLDLYDPCSRGRPLGVQRSPDEGWHASVDDQRTSVSPAVTRGGGGECRREEGIIHNFKALLSQNSIHFLA